MFSRTPANARNTGSTMGHSTFSVFGPDIRITGDVAAAADLHIDGKVQGDVTCTALVQGESGEIVGAVTAESARLSGTVRGTIQVRELADAGLVARTPDPEDGRASIIELTASGAECWRRHRAAIDRLALEAFTDWTTEDLVALRGYLERVLDIALRGTTGGASPIVAVHES